MSARPLEGVRVLEVAMYGFVPSGGAVLGEWGAQVIKIEHAVTGDPQRGLTQIGKMKVDPAGPNPNIWHSNRGKRSVGLDIANPLGRDILLELAKQADVYLTNHLPKVRKKLRVDVEDIRAVNPKIIYARGSALGPRGLESDRGGFDMTAFWSRGATAQSLTPAGLDGIINPPGPAYGDTISGTNLAGGIAAALFSRERTGEPSIVDVSLLGSGVWAMGHGIALSKFVDMPIEAVMPGQHGAPTNPLSGLYRTADGRYISLVMLQPARFWPDVCRHVDRPDLIDDPRFATWDTESTPLAVGLLREAFAKRTLAEWTERLATLSGPWAPVQDSLQVSYDPQVRANEYILDAGEMELVANPVQFDVTAPAAAPAPDFAAQTEEVLLELGYDWEKIIELKEAGAIT